MVLYKSRKPSRRCLMPENIAAKRSNVLFGGDFNLQLEKHMIRLQYDNFETPVLKV